MVVLVCGQAISIIVWQRGAIYLAQMKRPTSSTSETEDITNLMICEIARTGTLMLVMGMFSDNMMCEKAQLRALLKLR